MDTGRGANIGTPKMQEVHHNYEYFSIRLSPHGVVGYPYARESQPGQGLGGMPWPFPVPLPFTPGLVLGR